MLRIWILSFSFSTRKIEDLARRKMTFSSHNSHASTKSYVPYGIAPYHRKNQPITEHVTIQAWRFVYWHCLSSHKWPLLAFARSIFIWARTAQGKIQILRSPPRKIFQVLIEICCVSYPKEVSQMNLVSVMGIVTLVCSVFALLSSFFVDSMAIP